MATSNGDITGMNVIGFTTPILLWWLAKQLAEGTLDAFLRLVPHHGFPFAESRGRNFGEPLEFLYVLGKDFTKFLTQPHQMIGRVMVARMLEPRSADDKGLDFEF